MLPNEITRDKVNSGGAGREDTLGYVQEAVPYEMPTHHVGADGDPPVRL